MPSPGISLGDLMVFIAVVVIVAIFLLVVRTFIKGVEMSARPAEPQDRQPEQSHEENSRPAESPQFTSSQSASR